MQREVVGAIAEFFAPKITQSTSNDRPTSISFTNSFPDHLIGRFSCLHGTGGDENQLIPLGRELDPAAALLSPRGKVSGERSRRAFSVGWRKVCLTWRI